MRSWLLFCAALLPFAARAADSSIARQLEFQEQLEKRVNERVRTYDPIGSATVKISFKGISAPLPGTKLQVDKFFVGGQDGNITTDSISQVEVIVRTGRKDLPAWIKDDVSASIVIPGVKTAFEFRGYPEEQRLELEQRLAKGEVGEKVGEELVKKSDVIATAIMQISNKMNQDLLQKLLGGLIGLCALAWVAGMFLSNRHNRFLQAIVRDEVLPFLKNMQSNSSTKIVLAGADRANESAATRVRAELPATTGENARDSAVIERLEMEGLEALLADCYWCQEDDYAAFLWNAMSRTQQKQVLEHKAIGSDYIKFLQGRVPRNLNLHNDPNYVTPLPIAHLSQADLADWVREHPAAWRDLSYLRQGSLPLRLRDRLECMATTSGQAYPRLQLANLKPSPHRELPVVSRLDAIDEEDEMFLLSQATSVPPELRSSIPSLVWLALAPAAARAQILAQLDAATLAEAWIGPEPVLSLILESMPEQKRTFVQDNVRKRAPDRGGKVMRYLVEESLKALDAEATPPVEERKAA